MKNPITLEVLATLDAIDRRGSFAKAAEELNKATSAVSYSVQKLEEQLDITLFQRQGRRSVLTPAGQFILQDGRIILNAAARLADKAKEVATGWETRIAIAVESLHQGPALFEILSQFLADYSSIEIDLQECVLNGGWEALETDQVDLLIGAPSPVPQHKGYRAVAMNSCELIPVIAQHHPLAHLADNPTALATAMPKLRRVVTHDTSTSAISRVAGLSNEGDKFYVQNIEQKTAAILAGIGIGHLPRIRIQALLDTAQLLPLALNGDGAAYQAQLAWKISNKGRGLQALSSRLQTALC